MELNRQQIEGFLKIGLGVGGPIGAIILSKSGISQSDYVLYLEAALYIVPPVGASIWAWISNRKASQILAVKEMPEIATVVVKDTAIGKISELAKSDVHHDIVTESQNETDVQNKAP